MTDLKNRILELVKVKNQHIGRLISITTEDGDVIRNDVIKEAIESLVSEGKIDAFPVNNPPINRGLEIQS